MTLTETLLTVAVVVLFLSIGCLAAFMAHGDAMLSAVCKKNYDDQTSALKIVERLSGQNVKDGDRLDGLVREMRNHKAELAQFIKLANGPEQKRDDRLAAVESQVAGMLVSREVLTPPETKPTRTSVCRAGFVPDDEKAGFEAEDYPRQPVPSAYEAGQ